MIDYHCRILRTTRNNILKLTEGLTEEQFNAIPPSLNNNLVWNLGHTLVTQQLLCYGLSSRPSFLEKGFIERFRKGSRPDDVVSMEEVDQIKEGLKNSPAQLEKDYSQGLFTEFKEYPTSYGITLHSIEDAIIFNNVHESMHLGVMIAMRKLIV